MDKNLITQWLYSELDELIDFENDNNIVQKTQKKENTNGKQQFFENEHGVKRSGGNDG